jgi:hypothetical protein
MTIPQPRAVLDAQGNPTLVQLPAEEWTAFVREVQRMSTLLRFESGLTDAFREVRRVQSGKERGTTLGEFLQELNEV